MAIERQILANMQRALAEGNFDQLDKALHFREQFVKSKSEGLIDYPEDEMSGTAKQEFERLSPNDFYVQLGAFDGLARTTRAALKTAYRKRIINRLEDLSRLPDDQILQLRGISKRGLAGIRDKYALVTQVEEL